MLNEEGDPYRTAQSKWFITKVIFLCLVVSPRYYTHTNRHFDKKIGIFKFITCDLARRSIWNLTRVTIVTKTTTSMTADIHHTFLTDKVLPAIYKKCPRNHREFSSSYNKTMYLSTPNQTILPSLPQPAPQVWKYSWSSIYPTSHNLFPRTNIIQLHEIPPEYQDIKYHQPAHQNCPIEIWAYPQFQAQQHLPDDAKFYGAAITSQWQIQLQSVTHIQGNPGKVRTATRIYKLLQVAPRIFNHLKYIAMSILKQP